MDTARLWTERTPPGFVFNIKTYRLFTRHDENRSIVDSILAQLARVGGKMERVRQVFAGDEQVDVVHRAVDEARQALRAALMAKLNASPSDEELKRVSEVLQRATDELRRGRK